jgi:hypothetical protein
MISEIDLSTFPTNRHEALHSRPQGGGGPDPSPLPEPKQTPPPRTGSDRGRVPSFPSPRTSPNRERGYFPPLELNRERSGPIGERRRTEPNPLPRTEPRGYFADLADMLDTYNGIDELNEMIDNLTNGRG